MNNRTVTKPEYKNSTTFSPVFGKKLSGRTFTSESINDSRDVSNSQFGHNFGDVRVESPSFKQSCPLTLSGPGHCPFGGACHTCAPTIQTKLKIGQPNDKYEQEADRVAKQVMRMPEPQAERKACSSCNENDEEELIQAKPVAGRITPLVQRQVEEEEEEEEILQSKEAPGQTPGVTRDVQMNINNLRGTGKPLPESERSFFEQRLGYDFSQVRIHTGSLAGKVARDVNASAFTIGQDVVFGAGQYTPETNIGQRLLAHELTHVVQQRKIVLPTTSFGLLAVDEPTERKAEVIAHRIGTSKSSKTMYTCSGSVIQRKVKVDKPKDKIPRPGGKGLVQTNAVTVQKYLKTICSGGSVAVDKKNGRVNISKAFCTPTVKWPKPTGGDVLIKPALVSKEPTGCGCLCDLVYSLHPFVIKVDDSSWPHTDFDDRDAAIGKKPGGTGALVTTPSPNSAKLWGAATVSGKPSPQTMDPWLVLGHELCGHGWLGNFGLAGPDVASLRGEGGHQETVKRENKLRKEHGIDLRGTFKDQHCGESFWRDKKSPKKINWSTYRSICENWRKEYNKKHGTSHKITDRIP